VGVAFERVSLPQLLLACMNVDAVTRTSDLKLPTLKPYHFSDDRGCITESSVNASLSQMMV